jgi:voltage-gated potassium channel
VTGAGPVERIMTGIWLLFVAEFVIKFVLAPAKLRFLRKSWLIVLSLLLPALRIVRAARVLYLLKAGSAVRGLTLARVLAAFNRGLHSMRHTAGRFGIGYIVSLTVLVTLLGAAGTFAFERRDAGGGLDGFGDALWFTAMLMTTLGSDYWPRTGEGRVLCFLLSLYAFAIFGYVTATLATLLIGEQAKTDGKSADRNVEQLQRELRRLNERLENLQTDDLHVTCKR